MREVDGQECDQQSLLLGNPEWCIHAGAGEVVTAHELGADPFKGAVSIRCWHIGL